MNIKNKATISRSIRHLFYIVILTVIDQLSKYWAVINLKNQQAIKLIPDVLHLHYLENDGAVFGSFSGSVVILTIITSIVIIAIIYFYFKIPSTKRYNFLRIILVFILAGAVGNLIDRINLGYVVDFIYFALINFPTFNVADSYVVVAAFAFLLLSIFYYKDEDFSFLDKPKENEDTDEQ